MDETTAQSTKALVGAASIHKASTDSRIAAAIFDFDGTLVDTMPMHFDAYRQVLSEAGIEITRAEFDANVGGVGRETIVKLIAGRPARWLPEEIHQRKKKLIKQVFASSPITVLETAKLLRVFAGNLPMALASSGAREGIDIILARLEWQGYFDTIVTGEDVRHGKPNPEMFLEAARRLGVRPQQCVVFEDSDPGLEAADAAGMLKFDVRATLAPSARPKSR